VVVENHPAEEKKKRTLYPQKKQKPTVEEHKQKDCPFAKRISEGNLEIPQVTEQSKESMLLFNKGVL